jgi:hypothetical protein
MTISDKLQIQKMYLRYMYVCVCLREREGERKRKRGIVVFFDAMKWTLNFLVVDPPIQG